MGAVRAYAFVMHCLFSCTVIPDGRFRFRTAGLLACGSLRDAAFPVSQWHCRTALSTYSRGGGCGLRLPVWIGPSTFPFDPLTLGVMWGTIHRLLCVVPFDRVKMESDVCGVQCGLHPSYDGVQASDLDRERATARNILWITGAIWPYLDGLR